MNWHEGHHCHMNSFMHPVSDFSLYQGMEPRFFFLSMLNWNKRLRIGLVFFSPWIWYDEMIGNDKTVLSILLCEKKKRMISLWFLLLMWVLPESVLCCKVPQSQTHSIQIIQVIRLDDMISIQYFSNVSLLTAVWYDVEKCLQVRFNYTAMWKRKDAL